MMISPLSSNATNPRTAAIACAIGATVLGLITLAAVHAPISYIVINAASLFIGLVFLKLAGLLAPTPRRLPAATILLIPAVLLATALLGSPVDGIARWVRVAGIALQPAFLLLPLLVVDFARSRTATTTTAVLLSAAALALQPDRAMAGALAAAIAALALIRPDRFTITALAGSLLAFAAARLLPDTLAPAPYVEQVFNAAFQLHPLAGAATLIGAFLILLPPILGWHLDPAHRDIHAAFGVFWLATLAAAALGAYPTPFVGYGGSAILGYLLGVMLLPGGTGVPIGSRDMHRPSEGDRPPGSNLRAAGTAHP